MIQAIQELDFNDLYKRNIDIAESTLQSLYQIFNNTVFNKNLREVAEKKYIEFGEAANKIVNQRKAVEDDMKRQVEMKLKLQRSAKELALKLNTVPLNEVPPETIHTKDFIWVLNEFGQYYPKDPNEAPKTDA